jgi:hypothetical protein
MDYAFGLLSLSTPEHSIVRFMSLKIKEEVERRMGEVKKNKLEGRLREKKEKQRGIQQ